MKNNQKGFSLIELLLVVVIIGIISAIAVPNFLKVTSLARNAHAYSFMRSLNNLQLTYFTTNGRYARLSELNTLQGNSLGDLSGTKLIRGRFSYELSPDSDPTDEQLKSDFTIIGTKITGTYDLPYVLLVDQTGVIVENPFNATP